MASIDKSLVADFRHGFDGINFITTISGSAIGPKYVGLSVANFIATISFTEALTSEEEEILNDIIQNHKGKDFLVQTYTFNQKVSFSHNFYQVLAVIPYSQWNVARFVVFSSMDAPLTNYSIKIYDSTHNVTVAEATFTNYIPIDMILTPIVSLLEGDGNLEVWGKVDNSSVPFGTSPEASINYLQISYFI